MEEIKKETAKNVRLQEEFDAISKTYKEEHEPNLTMERAIPHMHASF